MELPVALQALQFAVSGGVGLGLGLFYDLLRAFRRRCRGIGAVLDLFFALILAAALLLMALYAGQGVFRLFMLLGTALGAAFWFLTISPFFRSALDRLFAILDQILRFLLSPLVKTCKIVKIFLKKGFLFVEKRSIISFVVHSISSHCKLLQGGSRNAVSQIVADAQIDHSDCGGVLYRYPGLSSVSDYRERERSRGFDTGHQFHRAGKSAAGGRNRKCRHRRGHHGNRP
jgi:hypothetical protein